jgi:hypothetical protein
MINKIHNFGANSSVESARRGCAGARGKIEAFGCCIVSAETDQGASRVSTRVTWPAFKTGENREYSRAGWRNGNFP